MLSVTILIATVLLFSAYVLAQESQGKRKGDINRYLQRTGAKFIQEAGKKEGISYLQTKHKLAILYKSAYVGR